MTRRAPEEPRLPDWAIPGASAVTAEGKRIMPAAPREVASTDDLLVELMDRWQGRRRSLSVDFRELVSWLRSPDRYSHLIHPYPAKLLTHIPYFFLNNDVLSKPGDMVFDPFAGSGTVLLEARMAGRSAIGAESNPLAQLVSAVKTRRLSPHNLRRAFERLLQNIPPSPSTPEPDVVNLLHWFYPHVIRQLQCILEAIHTVRSTAFRDFFLVSFSACLRKVSLADPRLSVPVRLRYEQYPDGHWLRERTQRHLRRLRRINVTKEFEKVTLANLRRIWTIEHMPSDCTATVVASDARSMVYDLVANGSPPEPVADNSVQLIITSPPYPGAQKYIRSSSLALGWLSLCPTSELRAQKARAIGREEYRQEEYSQPIITGIPSADRVLRSVRRESPLRAHIAANYLVEMKDALTEAARVLKPGGYLVLVTANNHICRREFRTSRYLLHILRDLGFSCRMSLIDSIRSRGLMTARNKTANVITRESVILLQKEAW